MSGQTKIRGYNTQRGRPAAIITLPTEVLKAFGWQPGMYLTYYPTVGRELVLVRQDQAMVHLSPDYDLSLTKMGEPMPVKARSGSIAEREDVVEEEVLGATDRLMKALDKNKPKLSGMAAIDAMIDEIGEGPTGSVDQPQPKPKSGSGSPRPRSLRKSRHR